MEYIKSDFEGMLLNVYAVGQTVDLVRRFPILSKYEEFSVKLRPGLDRNKVIRYFVYAFDKNSPLLAINDIMERRWEAARLAGFPLTGRSKHNTTIDMMLRSLIPAVNHMIIRYCILLNDINYSVMVTYEDSLVKELKRLIDFDDNADKAGEKKKDLINNINVLKNNIAELRDEFLSRNVDYFLTRSLMEFGEAKTINLSPEKYAEEYKNWDHISKYYKQLNIQ